MINNPFSLWYYFCFNGQVDLTSFIAMSGCSCLNESDENTFQNTLKKVPSFLESDCDEQVSAVLGHFIKLPD